jgi:hypothetical protein
MAGPSINLVDRRPHRTGRREEDVEALREALSSLRRHGLVDEGDDRRLSATGLSIRDRVQAARCEGLESLVADWQPESPELDAAIARLADELGRSRPPSEEGTVVALRGG